MRNLPESPGFILKTARERAGITVEALAEMADVSERYIYRIENEGKKPSYDVLYHLIRALDLSPDLLFYPEKSYENSEIEQLIHMLYKCDPRALDVIKATATALSIPPLKSSHKAVFLFRFLPIYKSCSL